MLVELGAVSDSPPTPVRKYYCKLQFHPLCAGWDEGVGTPRAHRSALEVSLECVLTHNPFLSPNAKK